MTVLTVDPYFEMIFSDALVFNFLLQKCPFSLQKTVIPWVSLQLVIVSIVDAGMPLVAHFAHFSGKLTS